MTENTIQAAQTTVMSDSIESWKDVSIHAYVRAIIIAALLYFLFYKEISDITGRWFNDASWSHGILIPFFSLYFLNQSKKEVLNYKATPSYWGLFFLICVILFYVFNTVSPSGYGYFRQISIVGALGAVVLFLGGWPILKWTWLPIVYLLFAIPLPERYYVSATIPMRIWAASASSAVLDLFPQLDTTTNGVIIDIIYKGKQLQPGLDVAEACSGMRLLMAFFALGVAMAYLHYRPLWQRLVLLASTIPISILCNIVRVTVTGFIHVLIGPEYAQGLYHDLLGMAMLPLAFGLYGILAWFMSNLFIEGEQGTAEDVVIARTRTGTDDNTD